MKFLAENSIFLITSTSSFRRRFLYLNLYDDLCGSGARLKFAVQFGVAAALYVLGFRVQIIANPFGDPVALGWLAFPFTLLWMVGMANAFNFVESMDGLAVGLGGTAAGFFMLVTLGSQQLSLSQHSALIFGACIGLYFFHSPPAVLFLGDSGAQTLGFLLSVLAIGYAPLGANQSSSWFVPIMLLSVPIFDASLVIFSRLRKGFSTKPLCISELGG